MEFETAEAAPSRRSLIGAAGAAGLVGAAAALISASRASASPNKPTDADRVGLTAALQLELTARDLYRDATVELRDERAIALAGVVAENHEAYAQAISGAIGVSADGRNDDVYNSLRSLFTASEPQAFASAARQLENTAVATHTELLASYESIDAIELTTSILTVEARQSTVFTSMAGFGDNLDDMLSPDAVALDLSGGAA